MASLAVLPHPSLVPGCVSMTAMPPLPRAPLQLPRRPAPHQGRALECLGHAIEYLIDSRHTLGGVSADESEAVRLLIRCSRAVFEDCPVKQPIAQRIGDWLGSRLRERLA